MTQAPKRPPALLVERLALGELDAETAARVRAELEAAGEDPDEVLAALRESNAEILADYPADRMHRDLRRRLDALDEPEPARVNWGWVLAPGGLAVVAAVLLAVWMGKEGEQVAVHQGDATTQSGYLVEGGPGERVRVKGGVGAHLVVDRKTAEGHERLVQGDAVVAGELVQLSYVPAGAEQGVIVSIDGAGVATLHFPSNVDAEPTLAEGSEVPLDHAYELDEAPSFERFFIVTREGEAPSVAEVLKAAEALAGSPEARTAELGLAGEGWQQEDLLLEKGQGALGPAGGPQ